MTLHTFGIRLPLAYGVPEKLMNEREACGNTGRACFIEAGGPQPTTGAYQPVANLLYIVGLEFDSSAYQLGIELQADQTRRLEHDLLVMLKLGEPEAHEFL